MITRSSINSRGKFIMFIIAFFWLVFAARAVQIQIIDSDRYIEYAKSQHNGQASIPARRGTVYDCSGKVLAQDQTVYTLSVDPRHMDQRKEAAKLAKISGKPESYWLKRFSDHPKYCIIGNKINEYLANRYMNAKIQTLYVETKTTRNYPYGMLADEIIGDTDVDNIGISGIEKQYDDLLTGEDGLMVFKQDAYKKPIPSTIVTVREPVNGSDIYLALDIEMQEILEYELQAKLDSCGAKWGTAIFMDLRTGGILACATTETANITPRARTIVDQNEPGSTAKLIPLATAFENHLFRPQDYIDVEGGRFKLGKHTIRDDHPRPTMTIADVGIYSSNVGAAKIGLKAGAEKIYKTFVEFGFGVKTGIDFPGESPGTLQKPNELTQHELAISCFGYSVSATALQLMRAYGVVASGGELLKPYIASKTVRPDSVEQILNSRVVVREVLNKESVHTLDSIFRDVVQIGTAKKAIDSLCVIGGKTGTALRAKEGERGYSNKALASFAGYFPVDDPRIVGIVMFDEPATSNYGGEISAPVFKKVAVQYSTLPGKDILINQKPIFKEDKSKFVMDENPGIIKASVKQPARTPKSDIERYGTGGFYDFIGMPKRDAIRKAMDLGMQVHFEGKGTVITQNPPAGADTTGVLKVELVGEAL